MTLTGMLSMPKQMVLALSKKNIWLIDFILVDSKVLVSQINEHVALSIFRICYQPI